MSPVEVLGDALSAVWFLWRSRPQPLAVAEWDQVVAQLERALGAARALRAQGAREADG